MLSADKGRCRKLRNVKNVRALEIGVPCGYAGINRGHIDGHIDGGLRDIAFVQFDRAADVAETAVYMGKRSSAGWKNRPRYALYREPK